jgi:hypothetical protein
MELTPAGDAVASPLPDGEFTALVADTPIGDAVTLPEPFLNATATHPHLAAVEPNAVAIVPAASFRMY